MSRLNNSVEESTPLGPTAHAGQPLYLYQGAGPGSLGMDPGTPMMPGGPGMPPGAPMMPIGPCVGTLIGGGPGGPIFSDPNDACEEGQPPPGGCPVGTFPYATGGPSGCPCQATFNAQSGNLMLRLALPAAGPAVYLPNLTYNAQVAEAGTVGFGWTMNVTPVLTQDGGTVTLKKQTGNVRTYSQNPQGGFDPPAGVDNTLVKNQDNTWTET